MAWVDWIIVAILVVSIVSAAWRGFFVAVFSLAGLIAGLVLASWNYQRLVPMLQALLKIKAASEAISFIAIALGVMVLSGLLGRLLRSALRWIGLGWADRVLGAGFGLLQGCIAVTLGVMALAAFLPHLKWLDESRLAPYFLTMAHQSTAITPTEFGDRIRQGLKIIYDAQPSWMSKS